jgi:hypothetical protein
LAFLLKPKNDWMQRQAMWLDLQLPILLQENPGLLAHAITIAEEADRQRDKLKTLTPVLPLPMATHEVTPPAESFFPQADYAPPAGLRTSDLLEEKARVKAAYMAQGWSALNASGVYSFYALNVAPRLEALPPAVKAVGSSFAAAAAKAAKAAASAVPGWPTEQQTLATAGVEYHEYDEDAAASSMAVPSSVHTAAAASSFAAVVGAAGGGAGVWATPAKATPAAKATQAAPAAPAVKPASRPLVPSFPVDPASLSPPTGADVTMADVEEPPAAAPAALAPVATATADPAQTDASSDISPFPVPWTGVLNRVRTRPLPVSSLVGTRVPRLRISP